MCLEHRFHVWVHQPGLLPWKAYVEFEGPVEPQDLVCVKLMDRDMAREEEIGKGQTAVNSLLGLCPN